MRRLRSDSGAVAVEFALVLIPLLLILMGVIDFGRVYTQKLTLTSAAREGARVMAVQNDPIAARIATVSAGTALWSCPPAGCASLTPVQIAALTGNGIEVVVLDKNLEIVPSCTAPTSSPNTLPYTVTVTATYQTFSMTGIFPLLNGKILTGKGVMRCGG